MGQQADDHRVDHQRKEKNRLSVGPSVEVVGPASHQIAQTCRYGDVGDLVEAGGVDEAQVDQRGEDDVAVEALEKKKKNEEFRFCGKASNKQTLTKANCAAKSSVE